MRFGPIIVFLNTAGMVTYYCIGCVIVTCVYKGFCTVCIATEGFNRLFYCWEQGVLAGCKCCIV